MFKNEGYLLRNWFFLIFALSGFSGLIYESIWSHYLKLFLGHAAYAQTLVLAIFMGGMALGSWLCSRYSWRWKNLLLGYALAEGIIGVIALIFHPSFDFIVNLAYDTVIPSLATPWSVSSFKWLISAAIIFPQSVLLGMTFPLMSAGIIRRFSHNQGATIAMLYFSNSIGGAAGVLVSGFVLIDWVGLPGTVAMAGAMNVVLAITVWLLVRKGNVGQANSEIQLEPNALAQSKSTKLQTDEWFLILLVAAFITGLASFVYEIGWIRMLSLVLGSSTHAFELMLSAFILGLALGGLWIRRRIDHISNPVRFVGYVQVIMGVFALSTLLLYGNSFNVMQWLMLNLDKTDNGYLLFNIGSHSIALAIMLPTTFCAGTTLPLITYALLKRGVGERSIGIIYSMNTVGAIAGIVIAVHLAMPILGLKGLITFGATLDIALGLFILWRLSVSGRSPQPIVASTVGLMAIIGTVAVVELDSYKMASGVYRTTNFINKEKAQVLDHRDGKTASVDLVGVPGNVISIRTNGKTDAAINLNQRTISTEDEATMALAAAIPLMLNPNAKTVANIGIGSGLTTQVLLSMPSIQTVDTVEIEKAMVDVAKGFKPRNERVYTDTRSNIHIEDAKTFFSAHKKRYDIIVSEPSNPWVSGVANLFSKEFYQLLNRYLTDDGLFVQWLHLYESNLDLVASILKALDPNFSDYVIYAPNSGDILIIGKMQGKMPPLNDAAFQHSSLVSELNRIAIRNIQDIELRKIADKQMLAPILANFSVPANSDYYPIVDQNAVKARFLNQNAVDIIALITESVPLLETLQVSNPTWSSTNVFPNKYFPKSMKAHEAQLVRSYLLDLNPPPVTLELQRKANIYSNEFKSLFSNCLQVPAGRNRISILLGGGLRLSAYLRQSELREIWQRYNVDECSQYWSVEEAEWLALIKAVGQRDARKMAKISDALMESGRELTPARKKYLLATGMLGFLASNQPLLANQFWQTYAKDVFKHSRPGMMFRYLAIRSGVLMDI